MNYDGFQKFILLNSFLNEYKVIGLSLSLGILEQVKSENHKEIKNEASNS